MRRKWAPTVRPRTLSAPPASPATEKSQQSRDADFELRVLDDAAAAQLGDVQRVDRDHPRVRLVDRSVPRGMALASRVHLEGAQMDLLGRLTVRWEETRPEIERSAAKGTQTRLLEKLALRAAGDSMLSAVARLETSGHAFDDRGV